ncbi:Uu.00g067230.m01.CDS01 [Anthostomella pinea]|uniref:Uu.00g067230.m01.CDS01 n=1 Tax=Anthostomella pinea TaxID=933095 RepID=A0AAI8VVB0_9PEZI|nr:Uu.00g067230.m01.CDS01 [Anthostomella pinea]
MQLTTILPALATLVFPVVNAAAIDPWRPADWVSLGCYKDSREDRLLEFLSPLSGDKMTVVKCKYACRNADDSFNAAGLEYGGECFCGDLSDKILGRPTTGCLTECTGNENQTCGGPDRIDIYTVLDV